MKKILLLGMSIALGVSLNAQVTIIKSSLITAGKSFVSYDDTTGINIMAGGTGSVVWDFSSLKKDDSTTITSFNPDWNTSISSLMPGANLFLKNNGEDDYTGLNITNDMVYFEGGILDTGAGPLEVDILKFAFLPLPMTNGTIVYDTLEILSFKDSFNVNAGPGLVIDSVRYNVVLAQRFEGVGHGKVSFGANEIEGVLMIEKVVEIIAKAHARFNGVWTDLPANYYDLLGLEATPDSTMQHAWWSDNGGKGLPVVQYEYEPGATTSDDIEYIDQPAQAAGVTGINTISAIVYPNPTGNFIMFKGLSDENASVRIINMTGVTVFSGNLSHNNLDVSMLNTGNYILLVNTAQGVFKTEITKK